MTKAQVSKVATIFKRVARKRGIEEIYVQLNENPDPYNNQKYAIYIDGDVYSEFWGEGFWGWDFRTEVDNQVEALGLMLEPWSKSIIEVCKSY